MPATMAALTCVILAFSTAAAEPAQQQSAAASEAMSLVEDAVHRLTKTIESAKQEPGGIIGSYISNTLQPLAQETVGRMQQQVDDSIQQVENCKGMMWSAEKEVEHREEILQSDEGEKFECLALEHRLHKKEKDACGAYDSSVRHFAGNVDYKFPEQAARNVNDLTTYFAQVKQMVADSAQFGTLQTECREATKACEDQHNTCVVDEETIQKFYCSMMYQRDVACAAYSQCYDTAAKEVEKVEAKIKALETQNKDNYKNLACFQDGVGNIEMDPTSCAHTMVDTVHLDVSYPGVPPAQECVHLMKMRRDYSNIVCSGGEVVWHPPTPAPPAATKAANATDQGSGPVPPSNTSFTVMSGPTPK